MTGRKHEEFPYSLVNMGGGLLKTVLCPGQQTLTFSYSFNHFPGRACAAAQMKRSPLQPLGIFLCRPVNTLVRNFRRKAAENGIIRPDPHRRLTSQRCLYFPAPDRKVGKFITTFFGQIDFYRICCIIFSCRHPYFECTGSSNRRRF